MTNSKHVRIVLGSIDSAEAEALHTELRPLLEKYYSRDIAAWYDVAEYEYRPDMRGPHPLNANPNEWRTLYGSDDD